VAIDRDDHDERLARIEQMLEELRREVSRFSDFHQQAAEESRLTRERSRSARAELRKAIDSSRAARKRR
jgi:hypothetical protein